MKTNVVVNFEKGGKVSPLYKTFWLRMSSVVPIFKFISLNVGNSYIFYINKKSRKNWINSIFLYFTFKRVVLLYKKKLTIDFFLFKKYINFITSDVLSTGSLFFERKLATKHLKY